jgi:hypothetical protein
MAGKTPHVRSQEVLALLALGAAACGVATPASRGDASVLTCRSSALHLDLADQNGATGHDLITYALRNRGRTSCALTGFPGVSFLTAHGRHLPIVARWRTHDFFGTLPVRRVVLRPNGIGSFRLVNTHGAGFGCSGIARIEAIPPDNTTGLIAREPFGQVCSHRVTVSPIQPGLRAETDIGRSHPSG